MRSWLRQPIWLVVGAIVFVQLGGVWGKWLFGLADPATVAWLRMLFALPVLMLVARPRLRGRRWVEWQAVLAYGTALGVMNFSIYQALARIPVGMAVTIEFLGPLTVAFLGVRRPRDGLWVVLAGTGVAVLSWSGLVLDWAGIGFAFLAAACWAAYILLAVPTGRHWDGVSGVAVGSLIGPALFAAPGVLADPAALLDWRVLGGAFMVAVCSSVLPYAFEMTALRRIDSAPFAILMSLEPAVAAGLALAILGEVLTPLELAAMACVITASVGATLTMGRPNPEATRPSAGEEGALDGGDESAQAGGQV
ncbi:MAG: EamA family transporter [Propionibacteriaceae bacterium]|jgi:inner membrane transporter RhtA|nr:EamA family transporter [Propionibacteriaceae bacterium]